LLAIGASLLIASCESAPPPPSAPPAIEFAGVPSETRIGATTVTYLLADGGTLEVDFAGYRVLGPHDWSGELVILGSDAEGLFVASFMPQGGLPDDCYVENQVGIDRGPYVETRGVLWRKAPSFAAAELVPADQAYPAGTRFCFDATGQITSTVAP
jgi:hypothetical protein